jgi:hypothetical protein
MAQNTQQFIDVLQEQDKVAAIRGMIKPQLDGKVDKEQGKGLSSNDYTDAEKQKLATIDGSHFKGVHKSVADLETAHPAANAEPGSYAYLKDGTNPEKIAVLDGGAWVEHDLEGAALTAAQIKALYESNADTNAFTDGDKSNIQVNSNQLRDIGLVGPAQGQKATQSSRDIEVPKQSLPNTQVEIEKDNRLITVANAFLIEVSLKQWLDDNAMLIREAPITDVSSISNAGIYHGKDLTDSPVPGDVMVMAAKDNDGNFGYFLMGQDMVLHTGGKPVGGSAVSWSATINTNDVGDLHAFVAGSDLVTKLMEMKAALDKAAHVTNTQQADPDWIGTVHAESVTTNGANFIYINVSVGADGFVENPANPGSLPTDGKEHYVKFADVAANPVKDATDWAWIQESGQNPARLWTNDTKTAAVSGKMLRAWIDSGAMVKIVKTGAEWYVKDVYIPAVAHPTGTKALLSDGSVELKSGYAPSSDMSVATKKYVDSKIPDLPSADGDYKLSIKNGVATWVTI